MHDTLLRPACLDWYMAWSARWTKLEISSSWRYWVTPMLIVIPNLEFLPS